MSSTGEEDNEDGRAGREGRLRQAHEGATVILIHRGAGSNVRDERGGKKRARAKKNSLAKH